MKLITAEGLTIGYNQNIIAKNLSFSVEKGDYLCVAGENGSGKTTLMKTILGLEKPVEGTLEFPSGIDNSAIGYLPQQTDFQRDFPASVMEIVLSGCRNLMGSRPFYGSKEKELAMFNLERMGMEEYGKSSYRALSGGQQQRVLLARALCAADEMLFLDEPVSGLDPEATAEMYALIEGINESGMTVMMISHDMPQMMHYASHVLMLGEKPFFGTKQEFMDIQKGGDEK